MTTQAIIEIYEEHSGSLERLASLLGAGDEASGIVAGAMLALQRRGRRIVDPMERLEFVQEHIVHHVRSLARPADIPVPDGGEHAELLAALRGLPRMLSEILVVSHYLGLFGPELAGVMRMTVRGTNQRLEAALHELEGKLATDEQLEALSQELADAIRAVARQIRVAPDETLGAALEERAVVPNRGYIRGQLVVVAAMVALALGAGSAAVTRGEPDVPSDPAPVPSAPAASPAAPVAMRAVIKEVPVYYVGRGDGKLYRELRNLPALNSLARAGVEAMLTLAPLDPDYISLWDGHVREVHLEGDLLTVDLSADAFEAIEPVSVTAAINQVVYTASEALGNSQLRVQFLSDGEAPPAPFSSADGFGRSGLQPMPGLWIDSPANQAQVERGNLTVTGTVKPDFGAPVVTITTGETKEQVAHIVAQTTLTVDSEGWLVWSMSVTLDRAGTYDVLASAGNEMASTSENKTITVE
jgi:hypothetical protein